MKKLFLLCLVPLLLAFAPVGQAATITLLHFSDYHSHAVPFYSEGQADTAGIARLIAYLQPYANDPNALIFSGGDMMNLGTPAWSDKYHCAEWPWFNGIVDAMAYGNHDSDYGPEVFAECRKSIAYPILSANTLDSSGAALAEGPAQLPRTGGERPMAAIVALIGGLLLVLGWGSRRRSRRLG